MLRARALGSAEDAVRHYRDWARDYDRDVFERLRFTGTLRIAELLSMHAGERKGPVLDLGCGTGRLGAELKMLGFSPVDGLDLSPDMLTVAQGRKIYREAIAADLMAPLPVASRQYAAAVSAGTFTTGHVDARALPEVLRLLKPSGLLAAVVASAFWESGGFSEHFARLERAGRLATLHRTFEPTRDGGPAEAFFIVARLAGS
ncbi:MAG: class I SAM-dependent methyltransferase [Parvibaculaceae bacterium]